MKRVPKRYWSTHPGGWAFSAFGHSTQKKQTRRDGVSSGNRVLTPYLRTPLDRRVTITGAPCLTPSSTRGSGLHTTLPRTFRQIWETPVGPSAFSTPRPFLSRLVSMRPGTVVGLLTSDVSHLTPSLLTPHTLRLTSDASRLTSHTPYLTPHSSRLSSHASRLTSRLTPHARPLTPHV